MNTVGEYNPRELEDRILDYWKKNKIEEKTLKPREGKLFSFLEGPPTANAPPALHHVEVRVFKDLVNRYHYMKGYSVPRKAGWDCHGLPVEVQVEKKLKLNSKKDILKYGVDRFVEECRESVFKYIKEWDKLTERMAYWIDLEKPYVTMDNDYIESVWWSIKEAWKKGLLYEGYRVVPYCPRCGTPLSSHEVALGYKKIREETVVVSFRARDRDFSFLAWTTTPWTLLSNLALAVHPDVTYATILYRGEKYVLAKELAERRFPEADVIGEQKGRDLVGIEYHPLFSHFIGKLEKPAWRVISGEFVTTEEGTGIVHIAPAFGEDDYNVGRENDLPLVNPIDEDGRFTGEVPELAGIPVKEADERIIRILDEQGSLIARYPYEHDYPFCWRCSTPLLYYAMKSWFIGMEKLKSNLIKNNGKVNWFPEHIKEGRFGDWLENIRDWSLSRNRFWGTPLPIWTCECGNTEVVGSRKELIEKASTKVDQKIDLHRPYVDSVKLKCDCGGVMSRVEYVIDCWYDSGAATFAQFHHPFENRELFERHHPYDFISEATDQTRGWFYTLLAISTILFDEPAYKNVVVGGLLLDDNGEKMSASRGNTINPWELFNTVGADAVRLQMCSTAPWNARRFGKESLNESTIPMLRTLWNCYSFTVKYMMLDGFTPQGHKLEKNKLSLEDKWVISRVNSLVEKVTSDLNVNEYHHAVSHITGFVVEDLSRWYIKLVRDRMWLEDDESGMNPSKRSAYMTLHYVFKKLSAVMAPTTPFLSEEIYLNLIKSEGDPKSVHMLAWPEPEMRDDKLELEMDVVRKIFEAGSYCRQNAGVKLRYPVPSVTVVGDEKVKEAVENMNEIICKQLNTKKLEFKDEMPEIKYVLTPNYKILGPSYGRRSDEIAKIIREHGEEIKKAFDRKQNPKIGGVEITEDMVSEIKIEAPKGYTISDFSLQDITGAVYIDTQLSQKLLNEALARELIRHVQQLRKKHDLGELDRIKVRVTKSDSIKEMLGEFKTLILSEVRGDEIGLSDDVGEGSVFDFYGEKIAVDISF